MEKRYQEFYCREAGDGCGGYILLPISSAGTFKIKFTCPKCKHVHDRGVVEGEIVDRLDPRIDQKGKLIELLPTLSAWSPEPRTRRMRLADLRRKRDDRKNGPMKGLVGPALTKRWNESAHLHPERSALASEPRHFLDESWLNHQGMQL